jgi:hypothetical protein
MPLLQFRAVPERFPTKSFIELLPVFNRRVFLTGQRNFSQNETWSFETRIKHPEVEKTAPQECASDQQDQGKSDLPDDRQREDSLPVGTGNGSGAFLQLFT